MGSWFSNLHVRKGEEITKKRVCDCIENFMAAHKCTLVVDGQDADITVAVVETQGSQWISVCSDMFNHDDPDSCKAVAKPFSDQLHTDVLGIACFDSDYLYLNLINADEALDGWIGIGQGKELGISRRNNVAAWKKKVKDYSALVAAVKGNYVCADMFLPVIEDNIGLPVKYSGISLDYLEDPALQQNAIFLYFRQEEGVRAAGPQLEIRYMRYAVPCFHGKRNSVQFLNAGDSFCGLSVYFLGPYVEHEEITFSDVRLECWRQPPIDMELEKVQLDDGQWAYCWHNPKILMPQGISKRMKWEKRYHLETELTRQISFVPNGNSRKMLDITIMIVPEGDPEKAVVWNIWKQYGSKEELISFHNKMWKRILAIEGDPSKCLPLLKAEDFD